MHGDCGVNARNVAKAMRSFQRDRLLLFSHRALRHVRHSTLHMLYEGSDHDLRWMLSRRPHRPVLRRRAPGDGEWILK